MSLTEGCPARGSVLGTLTVVFPKDPFSTSMLEASQIEWEVIETAIRKALENDFSAEFMGLGLNNRAS